MDKPKDYYRLLGVPRDASLSAIERAYRRLAERLHPGASSGAPSDDLDELQAAYETLTDADRRESYDLSLVTADRVAGDHAAWLHLQPQTKDLRRPVRPGTLSGEILLTPSEAAAGGVLPLGVPLSSSCRACDGTGGRVFDCAACGGQGAIERRLPVSLRIPPGVKDGAVFQVQVDDHSVMSVFLTVHLRTL